MFAGGFRTEWLAENADRRAYQTRSGLGPTRLESSMGLCQAEMGRLRPKESQILEVKFTGPHRPSNIRESVFAKVTLNECLLGELGMI